MRHTHPTGLRGRLKTLPPLVSLALMAPAGGLVTQRVPPGRGDKGVLKWALLLGLWLASCHTEVGNPQGEGSGKPKEPPAQKQGAPDTQPSAKAEPVADEPSASESAPKIGPLPTCQLQPSARDKASDQAMIEVSLGEGAQELTITIAFSPPSGAAGGDPGSHVLAGTSTPVKTGTWSVTLTNNAGVAVCSTTIVVDEATFAAQEDLTWVMGSP